MEPELPVISKEERERFQTLGFSVGLYFNPNTPVNEKDLFSGRTTQIRRVIDVVFQRGQHAIIFGERGVGKTSLANVLQAFLPSNPGSSILVTRINCDTSDNFKSIWTKIFDGMNLEGSQSAIGFKSETQITLFSANSFLTEKENIPDQVRKAMVQLSASFIPIIIIDEFDRLDEEIRRLFADLVKTLSDHSVNATIILIGVGDSIDYLINEHKSVSRALVQIQMPRMNQKEIEEIINNGVSRLGMTMDLETLEKIKTLSKGLPHYTHLIGLHATRDALDHFSMNVNDRNLDNAIKKAIEDSQHSIITNYHNAIRSARKDNLFEDVLLSCALAHVNELGEFAAQDLREPMLKITGKNYDIPAYSQHLKEFSESKRGNILIKSGERKRYRYKFNDPLMQPFVIMQGMLRGKAI